MLTESWRQSCGMSLHWSLIFLLRIENVSCKTLIFSIFIRSVPNELNLLTVFEVGHHPVDNRHAF